MTRTLRVDPPVDCLEVHEARAKGDPLSGAAEAHAAECPVCRAEVGEEDEGPSEDRADLLQQERCDQGIDVLEVEHVQGLRDEGEAGRLALVVTLPRLAQPTF